MHIEISPFSVWRKTNFKDGIVWPPRQIPIDLNNHPFPYAKENSRKIRTRDFHSSVNDSHEWHFHHPSGLRRRFITCQRKSSSIIIDNALTRFIWCSNSFIFEIKISLSCGCLKQETVWDVQKSQMHKHFWESRQLTGIQPPLEGDERALYPYRRTPTTQENVITRRRVAADCEMRWNVVEINGGERSQKRSPRASAERWWWMMVMVMTMIAGEVMTATTLGEGPSREDFVEMSCSWNGRI